MLRTLIAAFLLLATHCTAQLSDDVLWMRGAEMRGVHDVHWVAEGNLVVSSGDAIRIRDATTGLLRDVWREPGSTHLSDMTPDNSLLVHGGAHIVLRDFPEGTVRWRTESIGLARLAISADGRFIAAADARTFSTVSVRRGTDGRFLGELSSAPGWCEDIEFSPSGDTLAIVRDEGPIEFWSVGAWELIDTLNMRTSTHSDLAFAPDGHHVLVSGLEPFLAFIDLRTHERVFAPEYVDPETGEWISTVDGVAVSPDGSRIAAYMNVVSLAVFETATWKCVAYIQHQGRYPAGDRVLFTRDKDVLLSGGQFVTWGALTRWELAAARTLSLAHFPVIGPMGLHFSPDGTKVAVGDIDVIEEFDAVSGAPGTHYGVASHFTGWNWSFAYSPEGDAMASGGDAVRRGIVYWWSRDAALPGDYRPLDSASRLESMVAFSPDGRYLAWVNVDGLTFWNRESRSVEFRVPWPIMFTKFAFSPDSKSLAFGDNRGIVTSFDVVTRTFRETANQGVAISCLAWSPDGSTLATGSADGTIALRRPADGSVVVQRTLDTAIWELGFLAGGRILVAAQRDGRVLLLRTDALSTSGELSWQGVGLRAMSVEPNSALVAVSLDDQVVVYDASRYASAPTATTASSGLTVESWPNPATESATIVLRDPTSTRGYVRIQSIDGRVVFHTANAFVNGELRVRVNTAGMAAGTYVVTGGTSDGRASKVTVVSH